MADGNLNLYSFQREVNDAGQELNETITQAHLVYSERVNSARERFFGEPSMAVDTMPRERTTRG